MARNDIVHRPSYDEPLSTTVVRAVADAKGVEPAALDERLYDCVDPDALDRLFRPAEGSSRAGRLVFEMSGCRVAIDSSRTVVVSDAEHPRQTVEA